MALSLLILAPTLIMVLRISHEFKEKGIKEEDVLEQNMKQLTM